MRQVSKFKHFEAFEVSQAEEFKTSLGVGACI